MLSTVLSSRKVAAALAQSLNSCAPGGVIVRAAGSGIQVLAGVDEWMASAAPSLLDDPQGWQDGEENVLLETVACSTLSGVQDAISEARAQAWPPVPDNPNELLEPYARVEGALLHLWFANSPESVFLLEPVPLDALT